HTRFSRDWSSDVCSSDLHAFQRVPIAFSVGYQRLNGGFGVQLFGLHDSLIPDLGAAVFQLITVDGRNDGMADAHFLNGLRHTAGFVRIVFRRPTGGHGAEGTAAGTDIAEDHERCRSRTPALSHVGTVPAFANSV